ncbi:MAG: hypothetical protein LC808_33840 [Actinobacteria bacterium]|nr:hypothetical protein [Actinomycetota bacterium]
MATRRERRGGARSGRLRAAAAAFGLALTLVLGLASPASADQSERVYDFGKGGVSADHTRAYACDTKNDNNAVFTEYYRTYVAAVYDYNHTSSGCGWASLNFCITHYRVCMAVTNGKVCGAWQYA